MAEDDSDFASIVAEEIEQEGMECASVEMLIGMACAGDTDTVSTVLLSLVDMGNAGWAADICRCAMAKQGDDEPASSSTELSLDYGEVLPLLPMEAAQTLTTLTSCHDLCMPALCHTVRAACLP